jgi:hypothetical protein
MGRKNQNNRKSKYDIEQKEDSDEEIEDPSFYEQMTEERQFNIIWNARIAMIKYVDDMSLPLCDYLDQKIINDFVDYLANQ